jgi:hypothetical protein
MKAAKGNSFFKHLALAGALSACIGLAHASTITYDLIGVTTSAGSLTGTVGIDTITDKVTLANIMFNDAAIGNPVFNNIGSPAVYNGLGQDYISGTSTSPLNYGGQIALYYDTANIGTGNLGICLALGPCGTESNQASFVQAYVSNGLGGPFNITAGSLYPERAPEISTAAVSEPPTLLLLGTGILCIAGFARFGLFKA